MTTIRIRVPILPAAELRRRARRRYGRSGPAELVKLLRRLLDDARSEAVLSAIMLDDPDPQHAAFTAINMAIGRAYPWLADESSRQIEERSFS